MARFFEIFLLKACVLGVILMFQPGMSTAQDNLAFPGAEGFGKYAKGGRGGKVLKVTNLKDSGPGSLREALEAEGARTVIFEVGGIIDLQTPIEIVHPFITIAGQTAAGTGIVIRGNSIRILTHDVIMRFIRIRPGDLNFGPENKWEALDALTIGSNSVNSGIHDIIIDHCSFSWAVDENVDLWNEASRITIQNSIISEALADSKHPKGSHSKGMLVGGNVDSLSVLNNFFASNNARNPRLSNSGLSEVRNNLIFNPRGFGIKISNSQIKEKQYLNIVNNYIIKGPSTKTENPISIWKPAKYNGLIYLSKNFGFKSKRDWDLVENWETGEPVTDNSEIKSTTPFIALEDSLPTFSQLMHHLVLFGGSSLPKRDEVDQRVIEDFLELKGEIIDSQSEVGGWDKFKTAFFAYDLNNNGMSDEFEEEFKIDPEEAHADYDRDGYTNIEEFLNGTNPRDRFNREDEIFSIYSHPVGLDRGAKGQIALSPNDVKIMQNYPNPFKGETAIPVWIEKGQYVSLHIYDVLGHLVGEVYEGNISAGVHEFIWNRKNLASGIYYLVLVNSEGRKNLQRLTIID